MCRIAVSFSSEGGRGASAHGHEGAKDVRGAGCGETAGKLPFAGALGRTGQRLSAGMGLDRVQRVDGWIVAIWVGGYFTWIY